MNRAALSAESAKRTPPFTFGWLATIPTGRPPRRAKPTMISRAKRQIGRAHVWNSSHSQISYAVFCLKKKTEILHRGESCGAIIREAAMFSPACGKPLAVTNQEEPDVNDKTSARPSTHRSVASEKHA